MHFGVVNAVDRLRGDFNDAVAQGSAKSGFPHGWLDKMTLQAEIRSKLLAFETEFREMGFNLSRAFENVDLEPAMTFINNAKLVERILSEICEKKEIRLGD